MEGEGAQERVAKRRRIHALLPADKQSLVDPEVESVFFPTLIYGMPDDETATSVVLMNIDFVERVAQERERAALAETAAAEAREREAQERERAAREVAQERERAALAETAAAEAMERENQRLARQVWTKGLPPIVMSGGSGSIATSSHAKVTYMLRHPAEINNLVWRSTNQSVVYMELLPGQNELGFGSESDVASYVRATLGDIFRGNEALSNLGIRVSQEMTVVSLRPNIIIFSLNDLPIGYCEVKRPAANDPINDERVLGQAFDYAMELRHLHGRAWPFVILTTFAQWRVLTLDDSACRYASDLSVVDDDAVSRSPQPELTNERRALVSEVVTGAGNPGVASFLASVLLKMARSPVVGASQYRPEFNYQGMTWVRWAPTRRLYLFPEDPGVPFVRVEKLGNGRDGSCWLVAKGEHHFVLKIMKSTPPEKTVESMVARAAAEAARWRNLWQVPHAQAVTVMGRAALVVPFVRIFRSPEEYLDRVEEVRRAVQAMADQRHVHNDLANGNESIKWWHFGDLVHPNTQQQRVVAIDLSDMTEVGSVEEAIQAMSDLPFMVTRPR